MLFIFYIWNKYKIMVRFILHTILILVVSQLTNVVMGLVMTESEQEHFQQILIQAERYVHDQEHYQNHYSDCILPQQNGMSLRRSQLPSQIRILLEGIPLEYACINNNDHNFSYNYIKTSQVRDYKHHFHELCKLLI
ncbi:hypothetical protein DMB45_01685 [Sanguibacteroides justesenii]|uniref:Uncharacterized protein n=2 Tax=Sanguibacteroides justesenii TaxID=1547597 RepID=A0AB34R2S2_9PORP|nr:hypothetical protein IE90_10665 [Sanguibacteroides justesenii]PXZ45167.1 hypothetical protein DMB45_01685 [Sanguibacteroides justesenii]